MWITNSFIYWLKVGGDYYLVVVLGVKSSYNIFLPGNAIHFNNVYYLYKERKLKWHQHLKNSPIEETQYLNLL